MPEVLDQYIRFKSITRKSIKIEIINEEEIYKYTYIIRSGDYLNPKIMFFTTRKGMGVYKSRTKLNNALIQYFSKQIQIGFSTLDESINEVLDKSIVIHGKGETYTIIKNVKEIHIGSNLKNIYVNEYADLYIILDKPNNITVQVLKEEIKCLKK